MRPTLAWVPLLLAAGCMQPLFENGAAGGAVGSSGGASGSSGSGNTTAFSTSAIAASRRAPEVMFVVDTSGSMTEAAASGQTSSKWQDLTEVMVGDGNGSGYVAQLEDSLSAESGEGALLGLVTFSGSSGSPSEACGAGAVQVALEANASAAIDQAIRAESPGGGTPTAATLQLAAGALSTRDSAGRDRFIILLTDGAPDCNPNWSGDPSSCQDETDGCVSPGCCFTITQAESSQCTPLGCLDRDNSVAAASVAYAGGVETFVIGFGSDVADPSSQATQTLSAMAEAGGSGVLYRASSSVDLANSLYAIAGVLQGRCGFALAQSAPDDFSSLVIDNGTSSRTVDPGRVSVSSDRLYLIVDDAACAAVPGHDVTLTFE